MYSFNPRSIYSPGPHNPDNPGASVFLSLSYHTHFHWHSCVWEGVHACFMVLHWKETTVTTPIDLCAFKPQRRSRKAKPRRIKAHRCIRRAGHWLRAYRTRSDAGQGHCSGHRVRLAADSTEPCLGDQPAASPLMMPRYPLRLPSDE